MIVPVPIGEEQRLEALAKCSILYSEKEADYNSIVALVAKIGEVPISAISFVGKEKTWFKAVHGVDITEVERDRSFCAHAVCDNKMFIIEDTWLDDRFIKFPAVQAKPSLRFYAAMPLLSDGHSIGTLCLADFKSRKLTEYQKSSLEILARCVVSLLEYRKMQGVVRDLLQILNTASAENAALAEQLAQARALAANAEEIEKDMRTPVSLISLATQTANLIGDENVMSQIQTACEHVQHSSSRIGQVTSQMEELIANNSDENEKKKSGN